MAGEILLEEAETGLCFCCRKPMTKLVRRTEKNKLTQNETLICQNEKCVMFADIKKIKGWTIKNNRHYNRDFWRQNTQHYEKEEKF